MRSEVSLKLCELIAAHFLLSYVPLFLDYISFEACVIILMLFLRVSSTLFSLYFLIALNNVRKKWCLSYPGLPKNDYLLNQYSNWISSFFRCHLLKHLIIVSVYSSFDATNLFTSKTNEYNLMKKTETISRQSGKKFKKKIKIKEFWITRKTMLLLHLWCYELLAAVILIQAKC